MRRLGGKLIRFVLPLIIQALNFTIYLDLLLPARILAATTVAMFVLLFLIEACQAGHAPSHSR